MFGFLWVRRSSCNEKMVFVVIEMDRGVQWFCHFALFVYLEKNLCFPFRSSLVNTGE